MSPPSGTASRNLVGVDPSLTSPSPLVQIGSEIPTLPTSPGARKPPGISISPATLVNQYPSIRHPSIPPAAIRHSIRSDPVRKQHSSPSHHLTSPYLFPPPPAQPAGKESLCRLRRVGWVGLLLCLFKISQPESSTMQSLFPPSNTNSNSSGGTNRFDPSIHRLATATTTEIPALPTPPLTSPRLPRHSTTPRQPSHE